MKAPIQFLALLFTISVLGQEDSGQQRLEIDYPPIEEFDVVEDYKLFEYAEMRAALQELADTYPEICTLETAEEKFGIEHRTDCAENERC